MIRNLIFSFIEAKEGIKNNRGTAFLTLGTISISMFFMGFFFISLVNLDNIFNSLKQRSQVVAYLKDSQPQVKLKELEDGILANKAVRNIDYISKDDALEEFKREFKWDESVLETIGRNPLPASFVITLKKGSRDVETAEKLAAKITKFDGVEDVEYGREWIVRLSSLIGFARIAIIVVGLLLASGLLFIVSNTIRLSIYSRIDEINVMKLVGATKRFIRGPFVIEGIIEGIVGSIISLIFLYISFLIVLSRIPESTIILLGLQKIYFLTFSAISWLIFSGGIIGLVGAEIAISKVIRIRA